MMPIEDEYCYDLYDFQILNVSKVNENEIGSNELFVDFIDRNSMKNALTFDGCFVQGIKIRVCAAGNQRV